MKAGKKMYQACNIARINTSTFWEWRKKNKRLQAFVEELDKRCDKRRTDLVEDAFVKNCLTGSVAAQIFYLKNRGWSDTPIQIGINAISFNLQDTGLLNKEEREIIETNAKSKR